MDQTLGHILGALVRRLILVEIAVERLDAHIAPVSHEIGDDGVGALQPQLQLGFGPGHPPGDWIRVLARVPEAVQLLINLGGEGLVLLPADGEGAQQRGGADGGNHVLQRGDSHLDARVTLSQQPHGILFDHSMPPDVDGFSMPDTERNIQKSSENRPTEGEKPKHRKQKRALSHAKT